MSDSGLVVISLCTRRPLQGKVLLKVCSNKEKNRLWVGESDCSCSIRLKGAYLRSTTQMLNPSQKITATLDCVPFLLYLTLLSRDILFTVIFPGRLAISHFHIQYFHTFQIILYLSVVLSLSQCSMQSYS